MLGPKREVEGEQGSVDSTGHGMEASMVIGKQEGLSMGASGDEGDEGVLCIGLVG